MLLKHLRVAWLLNHLPLRLVWAVYVGINSVPLHISSSHRLQRPPALAARTVYTFPRTITSASFITVICDLPL